MADHDARRSGAQPGVLVISAWDEHGDLRVRITMSDPADLAGRSSVVVTGRSDVARIVETWLADVENSFSRSSRGP